MLMFLLRTCFQSSSFDASPSWLNQVTHYSASAMMKVFRTSLCEHLFTKAQLEEIP